MQTLLDSLNQYGQFLIDNLAVVIAMAFAVGVVIGSGSFAASIGEVRNRSPLLHFLIGCALPIVYPLLILVSLKYRSSDTTKRRRQPKEETFTRMEGAPPADAPPILNEGAVAPTADVESLDEPQMAYDAAFFRQLTYDEKGNYRGPFQFVVDGNEFKVERIVETLEAVVVIENINPDGKTQRLRIPYGKIVSCVELG